MKLAVSLSPCKINNSCITFCIKVEVKEIWQFLRAIDCLWSGNFSPEKKTHIYLGNTQPWTFNAKIFIKIEEFSKTKVILRLRAVVSFHKKFNSFYDVIWQTETYITGNSTVVCKTPYFTPLVVPLKRHQTEQILMRGSSPFTMGHANEKKRNAIIAFLYLIPCLPLSSPTLNDCGWQLSTSPTYKFVFWKSWVKETKDPLLSRNIPWFCDIKHFSTTSTINQNILIENTHCHGKFGIHFELAKLLSWSLR